MADLLLITDIPRISALFSGLAEASRNTLRISTSLESGGEEITIRKPDLIFVQTHLSGLSADILLKHLKKQLGRRRSRFILLASPTQVNDMIVNLFHTQIDTSQSDDVVIEKVKETIQGLLPGRKKNDEKSDESVATTSPSPQTQPKRTAKLKTASVLTPPAEKNSTQPPQAQHAVIHENSIIMSQPSTFPATSLEEQGVTYAPRSKVSVYSEFNTSFDSVVKDMPPAEPVPEESKNEYRFDYSFTEEPRVNTTKSESRAGYLIWLVPVIIVVIVVTFLQHRASRPKPLDLAPPSQKTGTSPAANDAVPSNLAASVQITAPVVATVQPDKSAPAKPAVDDSSVSDKSVLSAISEQRKPVAAPSAQQEPQKTSRLRTLPDFIPRSGLDKTYAVTNPGWERYKGHVTEFKVLRNEDGTIKAIQVIDRGGRGVPESFMRAALQQVNKKTAFVQESTEKKEGYEIQRGKVSEHLKVVYYRDEQGGRLRAFVMTWQ